MTTLYSWDLLSGSTAATSSETGNATALPVGRDIEIDPDTNEMVLAQGDLVIVSGVDSIKQDLLMRLRFFLGEWFLDTDIGVPYLEQVLIKSPNADVTRGVFREAILATPGVKSLNSLVLAFNTGARTLTVTFRCDTELGEINGALPLEV